MPDNEPADYQHDLEIEKLEAMAEFAAGAGHEINNPLTVISGRAQLLLRDESDPERRHALALISAQARRVHEMIADMMLFARPPSPERRPVDILELIDEIVEAIRPECARQETSVRRIKAESGSIVVEADRVQIGMAIRAICRNAIEALQSGGTIEIEAESDAEHSEAVIRIKDDGPGIKPEERRHIFDPYYSARQAGRGLGLGLSKAWRIVVTNHGGRIDVESQPGCGAVFTIGLPCPAPTTDSQE